MSVGVLKFYLNQIFIPRILCSYELLVVSRLLVRNQAPLKSKTFQSQSKQSNFERL
jgi:hypothetical protein